MIGLNHDEIQDTPKKKEPKPYVLNDLVNLRLTKKNVDLIPVLNAKKEQGVNISEYLANLIRVAEGLPVSTEKAAEESFTNLTQHVQQQQEIQMNGMFDRLFEKLIEHVQANGLVLSNAGTIPGEDEDQKEKEQDEAIKAELKNISNQFLNFMDDDDDDD